MIDDVERGTRVVIGKEVRDKAMAVSKVRIVVGDIRGQGWSP